MSTNAAATMKSFSEDEFERIVNMLHKYPVDGNLSYGTAGFRAESDRLHGAMFRVGVFAAIRSSALGGLPVGVMVTASHNPSQDNGAKIVEPTGSMLAAAWEARANQFVNTKDCVLALKTLDQDLENEDLYNLGLVTVVVGMDSRPSSPYLAGLVKNGVLAVNSLSRSVEWLGLVTTPQLHYVVRARGRNQKDSISDYYTTMIREFRILIVDIKILAKVIVDCANGVGAEAMQHLSLIMPAIRLVNTIGDGELNCRCGADYVQKKRKMPDVHTHPDPLTPETLKSTDVQLWASLDGDADRLVMFTPPQDGTSGKLLLADGDRFAALTAKFISDKLMKAGFDDIVIGVAQTAYSNGAATEFLKSLAFVEVVASLTGVKHLEKAIEGYDIGIYWEPNGHGTVIYSEKFQSRLRSTYRSAEVDDTRSRSLQSLIAVGNVANQAVGDGVADLLLVLGILGHERMTFNDWLRMYEERCSANLVVRVADKNVITTDNCDRRVVQPISLREAISLVTKGPGLRAFVRPSGTEDVVRVYAEAPAGCEVKATEMALSIARAVYDMCDGRGDRP